ncbi:endonuclease/exonuclease/phosphatase family protein [Bacteriovorax sp. PP10]|uniref:Endonuclease/exonuclease/phosphatase family protein n=1 Tax=Bacteriovorax antarcticus TaxID=3088717 RepID=A0ABU5VT53_9BACT|nr:endonuclease/exonuclease/phosphatase family protein [Bacteriovorax sp. PP10]MEA9355568.1 endonuclease/exonuclease/phosphatase family protein [Bacteriovorax sp. PP10]
MKTLNLSFLALTALLTLTSVPLHAQSFELEDQSLNVEGIEQLASPVPNDSEVLVPLGKASKKQLPPKNWSFLVWNLHKGEDETFKPEFLALSLGRDIIMNQEIYLDKNMKDVFKFLFSFKIETATSFFYGKEKIRTGVANISTVDAEFTQFIRTDTREPILKSPKMTLVTSYPIRFSKKKLTVVNIHGINFVSTAGFRKEMERIYQEIKNIPSPLVFAGDFNTWNEDRIAILDEYARKLKLKEAGFVPDNRITFNGNFLDHFLYTSDIKIKKARVDSIYKGSDHKPLAVEVEYLRSKEDETPIEEMPDQNDTESLAVSL